MYFLPQYMTEDERERFFLRLDPEGSLFFVCSDPASDDLGLWCCRILEKRFGQD